MEDSDRISDNEIARDDEVSKTHGEYETSEQDTGIVETPKNVVTASGNTEWQNQQEIHRKKTPHERLEYLESRVRGFRIAHAGEDTLLRGGFGRLPTNPAAELRDRINDLNKAVDQFHLVGDNLTVSGSFDKGYTVQRDNECVGCEGSGSVIPTGACCVGTDCSVTTESTCTLLGGTYLGNGTNCTPNPCACCEVSSIRLQVHLTGCVHKLVTGDCACLTFDCSYDHTWTCPSDFDCNPCMGNQSILLNDVDNSDCITCSDGNTPNGSTDLTVSIFPFSAPATVLVSIDPSFLCDDSPGHHSCGLSPGGGNFSVIDNWPSETCPINAYSWEGDSDDSGHDLHYVITLTIA